MTKVSNATLLLDREPTKMELLRKDYQDALQVHNGIDQLEEYRQQQRELAEAFLLKSLEAEEEVKECDRELRVLRAYGYEQPEYYREQMLDEQAKRK